MSLTSVLTKRRPGRPRKNPEATETQATQEQTAPVADTSPEVPTSDTAAEAAPVKRRGRPKGSKNKPKTTEPVAEIAATVAETTGKRRPGRPKGSKNKPKTTEPVAQTQVKRGPGRPRKNPEVTGTAPAVKRGPGRPRKDATATGTAAPVVKRGPGRPKGSKNKPKTTEPAVAETQVKRGPGRPRKNPEAITPTAAPTATPAPVAKPTAGSARKALQNPFKAGESIQIPSGSVFTSSAPTAKGRQIVRRGHNVTVHDIIPARVQPRKSEKGSNVLVRPPRIRAKGSGGYWKDITLTEKIVRLNGKTPQYEEVAFNPQEAMAS